MAGRSPPEVIANMTDVNLVRRQALNLTQPGIIINRVLAA